MKTIYSIDSLLGRVWHYSDNPEHFAQLRQLGFKDGKRRGAPIVEATVMSGAVYKATEQGFEVIGEP